MKKLRNFTFVVLALGLIGLFSQNVSAQTANEKSSDKTTDAVTAPDSTQVSVSGRVTNTSGKGISNVLIAVVVDGNILYGRTNPLGYYRVKGMEAGSTCIFQLRHKRYTFASQVVNVFEDLFDKDFTSQQ